MVLFFIFLELLRHLETRPVYLVPGMGYMTVFLCCDSLHVVLYFVFEIGTSGIAVVRGVSLGLLVFPS